MLGKVLKVVLGGSSFVSVLPMLSLTTLGSFLTYRASTADDRLTNDLRKDIKELNKEHRKQMEKVFNNYGKDVNRLNGKIISLEKDKAGKYNGIRNEFQKEYQKLYQRRQKCAFATVGTDLKKIRKECKL